jgi:hypothetical protein
LVGLSSGRPDKSDVEENLSDRRRRIKAGALVFAFCGAVIGVAFMAAAPSQIAAARTEVAISETPATSGLAYGDLPHQTLDIYLPRVASAPVILHVGTSSKVLPVWVLELTRLGWAVVDVGHSTSETATLVPEAVDDVVSATSWLKTNAARYDLQDGGFVVMGEGVGGLVAGLAVVEDARAAAPNASTTYAGLVVADAPLDAVVAWWFPETQNVLSEAFRCPQPCPSATFEQFSVVAQMGAFFPPTYVSNSDGSEVWARTLDAFRRTHRDRGGISNPGVWADKANAESGAPLNTIQFQLFLNELVMLSS